MTKNEDLMLSLLDDFCLKYLMLSALPDLLV
jgi:hypothetical protein